MTRKLIILLLIFTPFSWSAELSHVEKMKEEFFKTQENQLDVIQIDPEDRILDWSKLLKNTFDRSFSYEKSTSALYKIKDSGDKVAVLFFEKFDKKITTVKSVDVIEMSGQLVIEANRFYYLFLGKRRAVLILIEQKTLDTKIRGVKNLLDNARIIATSKTP